MTFVWGAVLAAGILLAHLAMGVARRGAPRPRQASTGRLARLLESAGLIRVPPAGVVAASAPRRAIARRRVAWLVTQVAALALVAAVAGALAPFAWLRARRSRLLRSRRALWPDVCDLLIASVRAGMSLPDAVAEPRRVRPGTAAAAVRRRSPATSRRPATSTRAPQRLKHALADPVGDRIVETLRMARQVGGTELTPVLRALATRCARMPHCAPRSSRASRGSGAPPCSASPRRG